MKEMTISFLVAWAICIITVYLNVPPFLAGFFTASSYYITNIILKDIKS